MNTFEAAMIDVNRATDADGLLILLFAGYSLQNLPRAECARAKLQQFASTYRQGTAFIHPKGEQSYLTHLALLANLTREAIAYESAEGVQFARPKTYEKFQTPCDLSYTPLEDAAQYLGPSFIYELHVNPMNAAYARRLIKQMAADTSAKQNNHPFAPTINLVEDDALERNEWFITANGRAMGSAGA